MQQKIKLVHIISILQLGGAESVLANLIDQLGNDSYEHHVIYFHAGPSVERIQERGVPTYQVRGALCLLDPVFWLRLGRLLRRLQPDLIHTHLWAANLSGRVLGRLLGIPVINTIHNKLQFQGMLRNSVDFMSFGLASAVVGCGTVVVADNTTWPINVKKITCIANGIDATAIEQRAFNNKQCREQFGWTDDHIVIGTVGRFEDQKNYHALLSAFAQVYALHPQTRLLMVGGGSLEQSLREHARSLGITHLVHFVIGKSAVGYFPIMDIFSLASHYEGLSIALLEAIACNVPCVTTAMNGTHELIHNNQTGILLQAPSVDLITAALLVYVENPDIRCSLSLNARAFITQNYSLKAMTDSYQTVYTSVLKKYSHVQQ